MGLRPASCYRDSSLIRAYTRLSPKKPRKNYIGAAPGLRTRQFNMGNPIKSFSTIVDLEIDETMHIRDNAIEAARMAINRYFTKTVGKDGYFMKIRVYPHQILRENKQAQGAGADRIQKGMSHPFGRPVARAARVKAGQVLISVLTDADKVPAIKTGLLRAGPKFGAGVHIRVGTDVARIGTRPKTVREETVAAAKTETAKEGEKGKETAATTPAGKDAKGKDTAGGKTAPAAKTDGKGKDAGKKDEPKKDAKGKK